MCRPVSITTATDRELVERLRDKRYGRQYHRLIREEQDHRTRTIHTGGQTHDCH